MKIRAMTLALAASLTLDASGLPQPATTVANAVASTGAGAVPGASPSASPGVDAHIGTTQSTSGFDAAIKRSIIDQIARLLIDDYVFPDMGGQAAAFIKRNMAAGNYDAIEDPGIFAQHLTEDLRTLTHDKHLRVRASLPGPRQMTRGKKPPRSESGFTRVDLLRANIGYLDLNGFVDKPLFKPVADKVMRLLAGTDALIVDLRGNGGGSPDAVSYLVSFFVDPKSPIHVNDLVRRKSGTEEYQRDSFYTEQTPLSYLAKPVVIITGPRTFSGGEEFAYDMQSLKRATLVGEVTGGGANPGDIRELSAGLSIFLPTGRAENPVTRANWEGRGVEPELKVSADQAFAKAYETALAAVGKQATMADTPDSPDAAMVRPLLIPRSTAQAGSEAALRRCIAELQAGKPRYELLSPQLAELTREQLPQLHAEIAALGPLRKVRFVEVGPQGENVFEVKFAKADWLWSLLLDDAGRIVMAFFHPK